MEVIVEVKENNHIIMKFKMYPNASVTRYVDINHLAGVKGCLRNIIMSAIDQSVSSQITSFSADAPFYHSSALIGLNAGLLVDWQTASVL